jgi:predicted N-acetyltransferase YhbS
MEMRFAGEADVAAVTELVNRAFQVERWFKQSDRLDAEAAEGYFRTGRFLLAEEGGALVGCIYVELHGERSYLGMLSVDPARQKTGVGRRLVAAAEEFARKMGAREMDLKVVNLRTELPPLYEKMGYRVSGTEEIPAEMAGVVNQPCFFVLMTKGLGSGA